jgi:CheY-like chemotaxis protein
MEDLTSKAILVVEDDSEVRRLVGRILRAEGYVVFEAGCGREGLETFTYHGEKRIAVIITDVRMPNMNGPEMIDHILTLAPAVGVVFMTGDMAGASLSDGLHSRTILLRKPFTRTALVESIRRCFGR